MAEIGRVNIKFGWLWILIFLIFGGFLEIKLLDTLGRPVSRPHTCTMEVSTCSWSAFIFLQLILWAHDR
jgi:hypothetical protein